MEEAMSHSESWQPLTSCQPDEDTLQAKKSDETAAALVCCSFYFKARRGITYSVPRARLTARSKFE